MTGVGLNKLLDIQSDVTDVLCSLLEIYKRVKRLSTYDDDVLDFEAYKALKESRRGLLATHESAVEVFKNLLRAYDAEKELMDSYKGLLNKEDDDNRRDNSSTSRVEG